MPHQMERPKTSDALSTATGNATATTGRSIRNGNRASFKSSFNRSEYRFVEISAPITRMYNLTQFIIESTVTNMFARVGNVSCVLVPLCLFEPAHVVLPKMVWRPVWLGVTRSQHLDGSVRRRAAWLIEHSYINVIFQVGWTLLLTQLSTTMWWRQRQQKGKHRCEQFK